MVDGIYHCNFTPGSSFFTRCSNSARLAVDFYTQSSEVNSSKYAAVPQAKKHVHGAGYRLPEAAESLCAASKEAGAIVTDIGRL